MKRAVRVVLALVAVMFAVVVYLWATLPDVRRLATENPSSTAFMELRARAAAAGGRECPTSKFRGTCGAPCLWRRMMRSFSMRA